MNDQPEPLNRRGTRARTRNKRLLLWTVGILVAAVVAGLAARSSYHRLKTWRANQFAAEGAQLAAESKWNEAAAKYRAALQLDPLNYNALRDAGRLATRLGRPEAPDLWEEAIKQPGATQQDREDYADLLVRIGRTKSAQPILEPLLKGEPDTKTLEIAANYERKTGDRPKALEFARLAVKRAPNDTGAQFLLADLLAESTDPSETDEAKKILWDLTVKSGETKDAALAALGKAPGLSPEEKTRILEMLESAGPTKLADALLAADLRMQLHPEEANTIYDQTVARWNKSEGDDLTNLARWLNSHQQPERVLSLFSLEQAFKDNQLLLTRLDALATLQRWNDIDALLAHPQLNLDPSVLESFFARTAQEKGAAMDAEVHWTHAISLAAGDPNKLRFVANFAQQSQAYGVALRAYDQLSKIPDQADFAYRATQALSARTGDFAVQRTAAEKIAALAPGDPNASAQLAYLNLLAGIQVETNAATARSLVEQYPSRLSYRVTAALGSLRQHDPGGALAQFHPDGAPPIDWERTPANWRAVYAAVLKANEQEPEARKIIATIPEDALTAEERRLIE